MILTTYVLTHSTSGSIPGQEVSLFHVTHQSPAGALRKRLARSTREGKAVYILQQVRADASRGVN